jgi:hypothetical protein
MSVASAACALPPIYPNPSMMARIESKHGR